MNDRISPCPKIRVIFSLPTNHIAVLNDLAMKSNRSRSSVVGMLIENAKDRPEITKILGGAA